MKNILITILILLVFNISNAQDSYDIDSTIVNDIVNYLVENQVKNDSTIDSLYFCLPAIPWEVVFGEVEPIRYWADKKDEEYYFDYKMSDTLSIDQYLENFICWYDFFNKCFDYDDKEHIKIQIESINKDFLFSIADTTILTTKNTICFGCVNYTIPLFSKSKNKFLIGYYYAYAWRFERSGWMVFEYIDGNWKLIKSGLCWMS